VADVRDAPNPPHARAVRLVLGEVVHDGFPWGHRPIGGAPRCGGQCAGRSQVAVALDAVTDLPAAVGFSAATCQPFRFRMLLAMGAGPMASKQLHMTWVSWRSGDGSPREMVRSYAR
jgi:hypothetical protein